VRIKQTQKVQLYTERMMKVTGMQGDENTDRGTKIEAR